MTKTFLSERDLDSWDSKKVENEFWLHEGDRVSLHDCFSDPEILSLLNHPQRDQFTIQFQSVLWDCVDRMLFVES